MNNALPFWYWYNSKSCFSKTNLNNDSFVALGKISYINSSRVIEDNQIQIKLLSIEPIKLSRSIIESHISQLRERSRNDWNAAINENELSQSFSSLHVDS